MAQSVDPELFTIEARVKKAEDIPYVREQILATIKRFQTELAPVDKLKAIKSRERYAFTMGLDNSDSVASTVARWVAMKRTPDTIDKLYALYAQLTPTDLRDAVNKYLIEKNRTIVTLTGSNAGGGK
jgi:zinc protease